MMLLVISLVRNNTLQNQVSRLNDEIATKINMVEAYQGMLNDEYANNNVLKLDISTLSSVNDKLLNQLDSVKNELKISEKALKTAMVQQSTIKVTEKEYIVVNDSCEFKKEFKPNDLTMVKIELKDDSLKYELDIRNDQYLYIDSRRDWKNKHKSFLKRLFTWDWKKINYYNYNIVNSNPIIKIGKTRVVENIKD